MVATHHIGGVFYFIYIDRIESLNASHLGSIEELSQKPDNVIDVLVALNKAKALAPSQLSNNVKGEELKPLAEVAAAASIGEHSFCFIKPVCERGVHKRLVVDQGAHGKGVVHASTVFGMKVFISGRE